MLDIPSARNLLARSRPSQNREGYPSEVRTAVAELANHLITQGKNPNQVATDLGIRRSTLVNWLGTPSSIFVPVFLDEPAQVPVAPAAGLPAALTLVTPSGFRLEGLDLDSAIFALTRLY